MMLTEAQRGHQGGKKEAGDGYSRQRHAGQQHRVLEARVRKGSCTPAVTARTLQRRPVPTLPGSVNLSTSWNIPRPISPVNWEAQQYFMWYPQKLKVRLHRSI